MNKTLLTTGLMLTLLLLSGCDNESVFINSIFQPSTGDVGLVEITAEVEMNTSTGNSGEGFLGVYIPNNGDYTFVNATCTGNNGTDFIFSDELALVGPRNITYDQIINASLGGNIYQWTEPDTSTHILTNTTEMCPEQNDYTYYIIWSDVLNSNTAVWQCTLYMEFYEEGTYNVDYFIGFEGAFGTNSVTDTACDNEIVIGGSSPSSSSSSGNTRYIVDEEGNLVGIQQGQAVQLLDTPEQENAFLSIGGGSSFDVKTWLTNLFANIKEAFVK